MTADEIWAWIKATPFRPFAIHLADGRQVPITDRWQILVTPMGRTVVVATPEDSFDHHDIKTVVSISDGLYSAVA